MTYSHHSSYDYPQSRSRLVVDDLSAQLAPLEMYGLAKITSAVIDGLAALADASRKGLHQSGPAIPKGVLVSFPSSRYRPPMPERKDDLTPARAEDLRASIAFALTRDGRLAKAQSAELMASIVAERLIARLERDGFVIMQRTPAAGAGALARGPGRPDQSS